MSQLSLERLLEGIVSSLRTQVLPQLHDPYARAQVEAAVALIDVLAPRIEWRRAPVLETIERGRDLVALGFAPARSAASADLLPECAALVLADPPAAGATAEELHDACGAVLRAVAELAGLAAGDARFEDLDPDVRSFLAWQLGEQRRSLRRPPVFRERLADGPDDRAVSSDATGGP